LATESEIKKLTKRKDFFRADIEIKGEPAAQANEMLENGIYGSKSELLRQGIRLLYKEWKGHQANEPG